LAPFNTTISNGAPCLNDLIEEDGYEIYVVPQDILKIDNKCREINDAYEKDHNEELDNGVAIKEQDSADEDEKTRKKRKKDMMQ
jgi:hypothetical protein